MRKNFRYSALTIEQIPRLCVAYKNAYTEIEGGEMAELHQQTFLKFVIDNFTNPDFLFLVACSGKKIVGFTILRPEPKLDGIKSLFCEGVFVDKDYRKHIEIAKTIFDISVGWAKKKEYKRCFAYENIDSNKWDKKEEYGFSPTKTLLLREV